MGSSGSFQKGGEPVMDQVLISSDAAEGERERERAEAV